MRTFADIDEVLASAGTELGTSSWHTITQEQIDAFADATGDHQWIHVDPERAAAGPFGTTIAHGYLTLSLLPMLVAEVYEIERRAMGVNAGSNRVRFLAPVPVGSRVRLRGTLLAAEPIPSGVRMTVDVTVELEGSPRPALVAQVVFLAYAPQEDAS